MPPAGSTLEGEDRIVYFPGDDLLTPLVRRWGLPIDNLTSQFLANVYLNRFDHLIKQKFGARYYIRYMDDMVVFGDNKAWLVEMRRKMVSELASLRLKIHENKAHVRPVDQGCDWLGFIVYPTYRRLRTSSLRRFQRRLQRFAADHEQGKIGLDEIRVSVASWVAHASHADTYRLRQRLLGAVAFQRGEGH